MNRRLLLSLYDRSGLGAYMPVDLKGHELQVEEHMEKFAELIVRECVDLCELWNITPGSRLAKEIKQHFGVEE